MSTPTEPAPRFARRLSLEVSSTALIVTAVALIWGRQFVLDLADLPGRAWQTLRRLRHGGQDEHDDPDDSEVLDEGPYRPESAYDGAEGGL
jgi:hypothetical protein